MLSFVTLISSPEDYFRHGAIARCLGTTKVTLRKQGLRYITRPINGKQFAYFSKGKWVVEYLIRLNGVEPFWDLEWVKENYQLLPYQDE